MGLALLAAACRSLTLRAPTAHVHPSSPAPCRQAVLDVSRGWYAALTAAPNLVPTARLSCRLDDPNEEHEPSLRKASRQGLVPCPQCDHAVCAKLRTAVGQLRRLSPRTLRVRLDGYDWHIVSRWVAVMLLRGAWHVYRGVHALKTALRNQCFMHAPPSAVAHWKYRPLLAQHPQTCSHALLGRCRTAATWKLAGAAAACW